MKNKLLLLFFGCVTAIFSQNVAIPDAIFKSSLVNNSSINTDGNAEISIAEAIAFDGTIKVIGSVNDLTGIEAFINITELDCSNNRNLTSLDVSKNVSLKTLNCRGVRNLTSLDVSKNTALEILNCSGLRTITSLDISKNTALKVLNTRQNSALTNLNISNAIALEELYCGFNSLGSLNVSKHINLKILECSGNGLTTLDVSKNTALIDLDCHRNDLRRIDFSKNTALTKLDCSENDFSSLDFSKNTVLRELDCGINSGITSLNFSKNTALTSLNFGFNSLTNVDVSKNTALINLNSRNNKLTSLDVSRNTKLNKLECNSNFLTSINVSKNTALKELDCSNMNTFTNLDVSKNTDLTKLIIDHSDITTIDITKNTALKVLDCGINKLTNLDISKNIALTDLDCSFNMIKKLDLSKNTALVTLDCSHNKIKEVNISNSSSLTSITCDDNELSILNIANGNNTNFLTFSSAFLDFSSNPNLTCITVDNATFSNTNWNTFKDPTANFSTDICYPKLNITAENGNVATDLAPTNLENYTNGDVVSLTATPDEYYQFDGWEGDANGTMNPLTVTMDTDKNITALFSKVQVTLTTTANNGTITVDKTPVNGTYDINTEVTLTAVPDEGYQFDGWSGDATGTTNPLTITTDSNKNITALFSKIQTTLTTIATNGTIAVDKAPINGTYDINTEVTLTAVPDPEYQFDGWSGDASGTVNPLIVTMDTSKNITALFSKIQTTLTTTTDNGTITVDKVPVNGTYDINTEVTLTVTPNANYQFDGWSGDASGTTNPLTITMDTDKNIIALFSKIQVTLTTTSQNGTITLDKNPVNGTYDIDTEVILTAVPDPEYQFDGWSDDASGTVNPLIVTMDTSKNITALFSKIQTTLTTTADNGIITIDKTPVNGTYDINTSITLTATPDANYQFDGWSGDASGTINPLTITMDTDKEITALFSKIELKWLGTEDNDWNNVNNWLGGNIPSAQDNVEIVSGLANYPTISNEINVNTITLQSNTTLIANAPVNARIIYNRTLTTNRHLVTPPVVNQSYENLISDNNFTIDNTKTIGLATYNNNNINKWEYKKNDTTGNIETGLGLYVELETAGDIKFTGNLNTNIINYPVTTGTENDNNLIGNPFTSYINSSNFLTDNTTVLSEETIWLWNGVQYEAYTLANPIEVAPTQGFFVSAKNNGNVIFDTVNQSHQTTNTFTRSEEKANIELLVNDLSTKVYFIENTTVNFDNGYDGSLFSGQDYDFAVYTKLPEDDNSNKKLAIQALPNSDIEDTVIPIGIIAKTDNELSFSVKTLNLNENIDIYLEDRVNNTFTNLSKENYKVTLENDLNNAGRFYLHPSQKSLSTDESETALQKIIMYKSAKNKLTITGLENRGKIVLYSLLGKEIMRTKLTTGSNTIDIPNLSLGVYIVKLSSGAKIKTQKIILD